MGNSTQEQTQNETSSSRSQTTFDPRSGAENQILNQYQGLGNQQLSFLNSLMSGGASPFALNPQDQAQLDQAYNSAFNRFGQEGKDYADYLATTRGLNKSDTPVSAQAMDRYGMGMADLLSQKANAGLNLGLQGTNMRMMGAQALPAGLGAAFSPRFSERMAGGITTGSGNRSGSMTMVNSPSLLTQIGQGMGIAGGIGAMGMGAMAGMPGLGAAAGGGMGSGAAANKTFGNMGWWL